MAESRQSVADRTVDRMRRFTERLNSGVPIKATRIVRHDTPDGPMHTREAIDMRTGEPWRDE